MAKIYANPDGSVAAFAVSDDQTAMIERGNTFPSVLAFDENSNAELVAALINTLIPYTLTAGVLYRFGKPVAINPPTPLGAIHSAIRDGFTDAQVQDAVVALWNGTATAAQQRKALAYLIFRCRQAGVI